MSLFPAYFNRYQLVVDKIYLLVSGKKIREAKFVRVTEKGFNFEDVKTKKCLFKRHLYSTEIVRNGMTKFTFYIIKGITIDTK